MLKYSKLSDYKIKKIMRCFIIDINASKTALLLNMNRKTINRYFMLFRQAIYHNRTQKFEKLIGEIEVDESYFGPKRIRGKKGKLKCGRGTTKQPVFGIYERAGEVFTEIVPDCKKKTLQSIIKGKIDIRSVVLSDGWKGYNGLVDVGYNKHFRVHHANNEFVNNKTNHINGIENFWSFTKHRLIKFKGVKKNFHLHLKECEWRYKKSPEQLEKELTKILKNYFN